MDFLPLFVVKIEMFVLQDLKWMNKRSEMDHFLKKINKQSLDIFG